MSARRFKDIIYSEKFTDLLIIEELKQQQNEQIIKESKPINNSEKSVTIDNINNEYTKYLNYKRKQQSQKYNSKTKQTKDNRETKDIDTAAFAGYKAKKEYDKRTDKYYQTLQLRIRQIRTITIQRASTYEQTTFRRFESSRKGIINSIRELILTVFSKLSNLLDSLGFGNKADAVMNNKKEIINSVRKYK